MTSAVNTNAAPPVPTSAPPPPSQSGGALSPITSLAMTLGLLVLVFSFGMAFCERADSRGGGNHNIASVRGGLESQYRPVPFFPAAARSYIERSGDRELQEALQAADVCNPEQQPFEYAAVLHRLGQYRANQRTAEVSLGGE